MDIKFVHKYLDSLEEAQDDCKNMKLDFSLLAKDVPIPDIKQNKIKKIDANTLEDIRFSHDKKLNAEEFVDSLDITIVDKTEAFLARVDDLSMRIFDFDESEDLDILSGLVQKMRDIIFEAFEIIDSLIVFDIVARAFLNLYDFLGDLDIDNFADIDKKNNFYQMMLAIANDLEKWIDDLFINTNTDDIHYFDASFSSNIIEIENIFTQTSSDEEDLEFF
jgi:hypothetical protein